MTIVSTCVNEFNSIFSSINENQLFFPEFLLDFTLKQLCRFEVTEVKNETKPTLDESRN